MEAPAAAAASQEGVQIEGVPVQDEAPCKPEGPDGKPLSRKQQKKLEKAARIKEMKEIRRAQDRERRAAEQARKREESQAKLATMTEEERAAHEERRKAIREAAAADRARAKARTRAALQSPLRIAIDLDFDGMMAVSEVKSLVSQLNFAYGVATKGEQQGHLHLLGAKGFVKQQILQQLPHIESWAVTMADTPYTERFKDSKDQIVYLTADSPNELETIDTGKVYVIGGIVDRNRHKALCLKRAEEAGVAHARLPILKYVTLATSAVITVNQVVELLVKGQGPATDWPAVLTSVLPARKRVDGTASDAGAGSSKGAVGGGGSSGGVGGAVNGGGASTSGDGEMDAEAAAVAAEGNGVSNGNQQQWRQQAPENGAAEEEQQKEPDAKRLKVV